MSTGAMIWLLTLWTLAAIPINGAVVRVTKKSELVEAFEDVKPGDEIVLAAGDYFPPSVESSFFENAHLTSSTAGTAANRIILRGEDRNSPQTIYGSDVSFRSIIRLRDGADYWTI